MIRATIFDLDGTLVQTEKLKALSYARAAVELRPGLNQDDIFEAFADVVGLPRQEVAQRLLERFDLTQAASEKMSAFSVERPWQAYVQIRLKIYADMLMDPQILLDNQWPHNMALLHQARQGCEKVGLATMSHCPQVNHVLGVLGLQNTFDFVASRDDVERGKPDPEIYVLVAKELGVVPRECLVIEDSPTGVRAALAAGMSCIAVSTPFTQSRLHEADLLDEKWIVDEPGALLDVVKHLMTEQSARS